MQTPVYSYPQLFINGQWLSSASAQPHIDVINPANGQIVATTANANQQDVDRAISAAKSAFAHWSVTTAEQRKQWILAIADEMQNRFSDLTRAISLTMGCPYEISKDAQVQSAIDAFREFADLAHVAEAAETVGNVIQNHLAVGVCVLINPWNYPLSQLVGKLGPALAAGCTVVVKPSEQTPIQDLIIAEIIEKIGLPAGVFNVITGYGADIGSHLCAHPDVDMVSFTGSTAAGVKVAQAAAPSVKRVCQELGGKSPYIITEDANLEAAVRYGVEDVMFNSGQTCSALTRMLVPKSQYQQILDIAKRVCEENIVGDPADPKTTMGPLSSKRQQQRVLEYIQTGIDEGARLLTGGLELPEELQQGAYVMPTIFTDVSNDMTIAREEIFGPVLCIIPYTDEEEAIKIANDTIYGLSSSVYAKDPQSALALARQIRAGQCFIQGAYFTTKAPFGGFKQSGNGREWGLEGLKEFLELQAIIMP
ncbi:aldehyde dehydrogenase family protein [Thalassotalea litorea]|uniref:Aldehyde dehydrogenase family protein n=1 Tax=Thalassotalea litorea TaxID=2020715 RepID=A0A5R9IT75_9GAMM|nr:aldehyde dehydrogenase family protein [Thalassotalea litorea]TLU66396.1 aldehyde dehydrogenase family protein [Thalassotalea litorea]